MVATCSHGEADGGRLEGEIMMLQLAIQGDVFKSRGRYEDEICKGERRGVEHLYRGRAEG